MGTWGHGDAECGLEQGLLVTITTTLSNRNNNIFAAAIAPDVANVANTLVQ